jgi:hypothetical protein
VNGEWSMVKTSGDSPFICLEIMQASNPGKKTASFHYSPLTY